MQEEAGRAGEASMPLAEGILMNRSDQREDGLHRHGPFFHARCFFTRRHPRTAKRGSFVSVAGVLRCYQVLANAHMHMLRTQTCDVITKETQMEKKKNFWEEKKSSYSSYSSV